MRTLLLLTLLNPFAALASDPATLHVNVTDGKYRSFKLTGHYRKPVTKFEVAADFGQHFGCFITADVNRPEDLHPKGLCGLPVDTSTGKLMETNWTTRIVYVEFADGMRWAPRRAKSPRY